MCGDCREALRCPGWPQAIARAARSGLDSRRRAAWHWAGRSPLRFVVRSWECDDELGDFLLIRRSHSSATPGQERSSRASWRTVLAPIYAENGDRACVPGRPPGTREAGLVLQNVVIEAVLRELRPASVMAELSRFSFPLAIGEAQEHSRPAARCSRFPGLLPLAASGSHLQKISLLARHKSPLGSSCTPRPSGQYVPTGQKPI
jgi:hypothetical protein